MKIISSPIQIRHRPQQIMLRGRMIRPVEQPEHATILVDSLTKDGHEAVAPAAHSLKPVFRVHERSYVEFLKTAYDKWREQPDAGLEVLPNTHHYRGFSGSNQPPGRPPANSVSGQAGWFVSDLTCAIGEETWVAVAASVRSAIHGAELCASGTESVFAACRPPGHHAYRDQAAGFCFLNNAAVAADILTATFGRIAVIDFDTHHGDGTQSIFYGRNDVFVGSVHTDPSGYYPFYVGYSDERGAGEGDGYNLNLPLPPGSGDDEFVAACKTLTAAAVDRGCHALVISAGWDAHEKDPLSVLRVSDDGFARIGEIIGRLQLPTVIVQEGGYSLDVIAQAPRRFLCGFANHHKD